MDKNIITTATRWLAIIGLVFSIILISLRLIQLQTEASSPADHIYKATALDRTLKSSLAPDSATSEIDRQSLEEALGKAAPLSTRPFVSRMTQAVADEELNKAGAIARHILKRNSRLEVAHLIAAQAAFQENNFDNGLAHLTHLLRVDPERRNEYIEAIVSLAAIRTSWPAIDRTLQERPAWGPDLLERLAGTIDDAPFYSKLYSYFPDSDGSHISALSQRGNLDQAFIAFVNFIDAGKLENFTTPFDREFQGLHAPEPFNWSITQKFAELERSGGLYVFYTGRGRPVIASQTLFLSPGRYAFATELTGESSQTGGHLRWSLTCLGSNTVIGSMDLMELSTFSQTIDFAFEVPQANCDFQTLNLSGVAGQFPRTTRANLSRVTIDPITSGNTP